MERIKNFFKDESGASAVEYGLLLALVSLMIVIGATTVGTQLDLLFKDAGAQLTTAAS
jgi:pilus assembly protein Flp/PilA